MPIKYLRILNKECRKIKHWKILQILAASENQANCKILAANENQADWKILVANENQADGKILVASENQVDGKSWKSRRKRKSRRNWKSRRPAYCLGSAESPTADFSMVPLMSTFSSSLMWWISHVVSKWGGSCCHPAFMGGLSPVLYRLFVLARHFRLEFHWFLSNHNNL